MASFFSSLLTSLKVTFFSPPRNTPSPTKEETEKEIMPSLDETMVNGHSKMNHEEKAEKGREALSTSAGNGIDNGDDLMDMTTPKKNGVIQHQSETTELVEKVELESALLVFDDTYSPLSETNGSPPSISIDQWINQKKEQESPPSVNQIDHDQQKELSPATDQTDQNQEKLSMEPISISQTDQNQENESPPLAYQIDQDQGKESLNQVDQNQEKESLIQVDQNQGKEPPPSVNQIGQSNEEESPPLATINQIDQLQDKEAPPPSVNQDGKESPLSVDQIDQEKANESIVEEKPTESMEEKRATESIEEKRESIFKEETKSPMQSPQEKRESMVQEEKQSPPELQLTTPPEIEMHRLVYDSPNIGSEQESFVSAQSRLVAEDFNDSVEPMDIDMSMEVAEKTTMFIGHPPVEESPTTATADAQFFDDPSLQKTMSVEEEILPPTPAVVVALPVTATSDMVEEKPVCGKGSYAIDWDNFDENAVPNPFGGRASSTGKAKTAVKRSPKKSAAATTVTAEEKKKEQTEQPPADDNANQLKTVETNSKTQKEKAEKNGMVEDDLKNSNVAAVGETMSAEITNGGGDKQISNQNKEPAVVRNAKTGRQTNQQTAVVAPTVHVAAAVSVAPIVESSENVAASSRNPLRRAPIKAQAVVAGNSTTTSLQQAAPVPSSQNNRHQSPKGVRSGDESISEEEMFVMASSDMMTSSSDPFNDTAAFAYLQQAGGNGGGDNKLHRQSLYQNFDPLVGGGGGGEASGDGGQQNQKKSQQLATATNDAVSLSDVTFTEKDDLLVHLNTPSPVSRDQSRADDPASAPQTVVKKKHGPKVQQAAVNENQGEETDRHAGVSQNQATTSPSASAAGVTPELKLQFQALLLAKEKEFMFRLQEEKEKRSKAEQELAAVKKETETSKQHAAEMSFVVAEYEKTVRQLIADKDNKPKQHRSSGEFDTVVKERDQALDNLQTVENAFSELNRRYETLRSSAVEFKKNEEALKTSLAEYQHKLKKSEDKFNKLYAHAEHKLELANQEIEKLQKSKETDTLALRAQLKKRDLQVETYEKNMEQKQKEIQELSSICDELIQKAGGH